MSAARQLVSRVSRCRALRLLLPASARAPQSLRRAVSTTARPTAFESSTSASNNRFIIRSALFTAQALFFTTLGVIMATTPAYEDVRAIFSTLSAAATLIPATPLDADAQAKEEFIDALPLTADMRGNPSFTEIRTHRRLPPGWRGISLTAGALAGPGKMAVPPFSWSEEGGKSLVQIFHAGSDMCGHVGILHGGYLATMLDEGLGICCFPALPHRVGVTAKLQVNYKAPAMANQYLVLRATTTNVEGRKAWVEGHIETLPTSEHEEPVVLATASALYISPKQAATMAKILPVK